MNERCKCGNGRWLWLNDRLQCDHCSEPLIGEAGVESILEAVKQERDRLKERVANYEDDSYPPNRVLKEIDELISDCEYEYPDQVYRSVKQLKQERDNLKKQLQARDSAVDKAMEYMQHKINCDKKKSVVYVNTDCTCGHDEAFRAIEASRKENSQCKKES